jgi:hypothetical protein
MAEQIRQGPFKSIAMQKQPNPTRSILDSYLEPYMASCGASLEGKLSIQNLPPPECTIKHGTNNAIIHYIRTHNLPLAVTFSDGETLPFIAAWVPPIRGDIMLVNDNMVKVLDQGETEMNKHTVHLGFLLRLLTVSLIRAHYNPDATQAYKSEDSDPPGLYMPDPDAEPEFYYESGSKSPTYKNTMMLVKPVSPVSNMTAVPRQLIPPQIHRPIPHQLKSDTEMKFKTNRYDSESPTNVVQAFERTPDPHIPLHKLSSTAEGQKIYYAALYYAQKNLEFKTGLFYHDILKTNVIREGELTSLSERDMHMLTRIVKDPNSLYALGSLATKDNYKSVEYVFMTLFELDPPRLEEEFGLKLTLDPQVCKSFQYLAECIQTETRALKTQFDECCRWIPYVCDQYLIRIKTPNFLSVWGGLKKDQFNLRRREPAELNLRRHEPANTGVQKRFKNASVQANESDTNAVSVEPSVAIAERGAIEHAIDTDMKSSGTTLPENTSSLSPEASQPLADISANAIDMAEPLEEPQTRKKRKNLAKSSAKSAISYRGNSRRTYLRCMIRDLGLSGAKRHMRDLLKELGQLKLDKVRLEVRADWRAVLKETGDH